MSVLGVQGHGPCQVPAQPPRQVDGWPLPCHALPQQGLNSVGRVVEVCCFLAVMQSGGLHGFEVEQSDLHEMLC